MGDSHSKLLDASDREKLFEVEAVLKQFPTIINEPFAKTSSMNALVRSVWRGNMEITMWLLDHGANIDMRSRQMITK